MVTAGTRPQLRNDKPHTQPSQGHNSPTVSLVDSHQTLGLAILGLSIVLYVHVCGA